MRMLSFLFITLSACAHSFQIQPTPDIDLKQCSLPALIAVSDDIPREEEKIIVDAIHFWNQQAPVFFYWGRIPIDSIDKSIITVVDYPKDTPIVSAPQIPWKEHEILHLAATHWEANRKGCITHASVSLLVQFSSLEPEIALFAIKHELGHVLGLADQPGSGSLMSATPIFGSKLQQHLTDEERRQFRNIYPTR